MDYKGNAGILRAIQKLIKSV